MTWLLTHTELTDTLTAHYLIYTVILRFKFVDKINTSCPESVSNYYCRKAGNGDLHGRKTFALL